MLALAAEKFDGAHPYSTTPEHTAQALEILGPDEMVCVEQKIVLSTAEARAAARQTFSMYSSLPNYRNNWPETERICLIRSVVVRRLLTGRAEKAA